MLPDGSGAGRGGAGAEPAAEAPETLTFSLDELNQHRGQLLGGGVFGDVYSLRGFPGLAAKEIRLDGQQDRLKDITKFELEALSQFSHPGVLKYHQVIEDGDFLYIIMDRYHGDLQRFITDHARNRRSIPKEVIHSILRQLTEALAYVHAPRKVNEKGDVLPGIVHRDLKPANILVSEDGNRVALADFGLCKDALRSGSTFAGTKPYMAPETLLSNKTSRASDIWALGVIIYELAALKRPDFLGDKEPKDVFTSGWRPDLSPVRDDFMREILEKVFVLDPEERLTARDLCELLRVSDASVVGMKLQGMMLEEALNKANARIAILEGDTRTKSEKITALEEALAAKSAEINSLESTIAAQAAEMDALKKELNERDDEPSRTTASVEAARTRIQALEDENAALRAQLEVAQVLGDTEHVRMLEDQLQGARKELAELRIALEAKEMEAEELRALNDQLVAKTAGAEKAAELGQLVKQLEDAREQLMSLQDKYDCATAEMEAVRKVVKEVVSTPPWVPLCRSGAGTS